MVQAAGAKSETLSPKQPKQKKKKKYKTTTKTKDWRHGSSL
jgi:hypothetical protein